MEMSDTSRRKNDTDDSSQSDGSEEVHDMESFSDDSSSSGSLLCSSASLRFAPAYDRTQNNLSWFSGRHGGAVDKDDDGPFWEPDLELLCRAKLSHKKYTKRIKHVLKNKAYRVLNTRLMRAVTLADVEEVQRLLEAKANPNAVCHTKFMSACHIAALQDNDILSILLKHGAKKIMRDPYGRTPLHIAAWCGNMKPLFALLGIPEELQEKIEDGRVTAETENDIKEFSDSTNLKAMLIARCHDYTHGKNMKIPKHRLDNKDHCCEDIKISLPYSYPGWTPLHSAASSASFLCCRVLLAAGADPCAIDDYGLTPLAVAGSDLDEEQPIGSASIKINFTDVVNILANKEKCCDEKNRSRLDWALRFFQILEESGWPAKPNRLERSLICSKLKMNTSLHAAVELECSEAIVLLLQQGGSLIILDESCLTPLQLCVKKRSKQVLQIFVDFLSDERSPDYWSDLQCEDGYSTLHYAIYLDWLEGVRICLKARASASMEPAHNGDTPLHTAASRGNINILKEVVQFAKSNHMINVQNGVGETALLKAITKGHTKCVKMLLQEGASIKMTTPTQYNVFHLSAKRGHVELLKVLLDHDEKFTKENVNALTDDDRGFGPIHFALENNHIECVNLLLSKKADIGLQTVNNSTLLHIAASKNNLAFAKFILESQPSQINNVDDLGWSPLHTASIIRARNFTRLLILNGADLSARTTGPKNNHMTAIEMIINNISKPIEFLESIFDMCICTHRSKHLQDDTWFDLDPDLEVIVDYSILLPKTETKNRYVKLEVIDALLETGNNSGQMRLLIHPLLESFICLKWNALVPFFYTMLFIYGLFVLTFTIFVMTVFGYKDSPDGKMKKPFVWNTTFWTFTLYVTIIMVFLQEATFLTVNLKNYVLQIETWVKLVSITLAMVLPNLIEQNQPPSLDTEDWPRHVATTAILMCWMYLIILLSRFPKWGCYVLMFRKVFSNVVKILLTFACLVFGFTLSFMIQFHHQKSFESFWTALVKTMVMMTSEFDYDDLVDNEDTSQIKSLEVIRVIFLIFLILAAIVLMNLMVGVSVNDLNNLEVLGRIMQLEKQVELVNNISSSLETFFFKTVFIMLLPKVYLNFPDKLIFKPYEPNRKYDRAIPAHVRDAIFKKAVAQENIDDKQINLESLMNQLNKIRELINLQTCRVCERRKGNADMRAGSKVRARYLATRGTARIYALHRCRKRQNKDDRIILDESHKTAFETQKKLLSDLNTKLNLKADTDEVARSPNQKELVINMPSS